MTCRLEDLDLRRAATNSGAAAVRWRPQSILHHAQRDDLHAAAGGPARRQQPHAALRDDEVFHHRGEDLVQVRDGPREICLANSPELFEGATVTVTQD